MQFLRGFYRQVKAMDMVEKSSYSSSSEIDKVVEGEPIITWSCAVRKEFFAEPGWSSYGQKRIFVRMQILHSVTKGWSVISTESLPCLAFTDLSSVTKTPRLQWHWKSSVTKRSEADDKTTKVARRRSQGCTACTDSVALWWLHILLICIPSLQLYEIKFFRGSLAIVNKKKLSQFLMKRKKKLVWFCE